MKVSLIIPVLNEADCIGALLAELPPDAADEVLVVDNGSTDATAEIARRAGVRVISEPTPARRGWPPPAARCWSLWTATAAFCPSRSRPWSRL